MRNTGEPGPTFFILAALATFLVLQFWASWARMSAQGTTTAPSPLSSQAWISH